MRLGHGREGPRTDSDGVDVRCSTSLNADKGKDEPEDEGEESDSTARRKRVSDVSEGRDEANAPRVQSEFRLGHHHRKIDRNGNADEPVDSRNLGERTNQHNARSEGGRTQKNAPARAWARGRGRPGGSRQ